MPNTGRNSNNSKTPTGANEMHTSANSRVHTYGMRQGAAHPRPHIGMAPNASDTNTSFGYAGRNAGNNTPYDGVSANNNVVGSVFSSTSNNVVNNASNISSAEANNTFSAASNGNNASNRDSASNNSSAPKQKQKRPKSFWVAIIVAILCIVIALLLALNMCANNSSSSRDGDLGQLDGKSQDEIQAELDRVVEEGMFNISIASMVEFEDGASEGELRIENVPNNPYLMKVLITRTDTGEQVYKTGIIEPNHHIQKDKLDVSLPKGTYDCIATFSALDPETEEEVGEASAAITINVKN